MVNWPVTLNTMSLAKSIKQTTGLSLKKGCNPNHHHLSLNSSSSHATPSAITTSTITTSSHKSHHLSQTQHTKHRSHGTHSSSLPSSPSEVSINKHLFSVKPKDSIFDQEDVNRICKHVKFNKMEIEKEENDNNNQMIQPKINTDTTENKNEIDYKRKEQQEKQDEQDEEYVEKEEQDEDYINRHLTKRCPNAKILSMTRSKSMHDLSNYTIFSDLTRKENDITQRRDSWPFGSIGDNMDKISNSNILPGGISINNINKFEKEEEDDDDDQEYGNQKGIKIKHSPWDKNIDWNCVNITL